MVLYILCEMPIYMVDIDCSRQIECVWQEEKMGQISVYDLMDSNGKFDYGKYREAADNWSKMRIGAMKNIMQDPAKQAKQQEVFRQGPKDMIAISEEGMQKMKEMQANRQPVEDADWLDPFAHEQIGVNVATYVAALAEVGGELNAHQGLQNSGSGTMGAAYGALRAEIESRYADPNYKRRIVVEEDGVTAHLMTKEEEIALLDEAYDSVAESAAMSAKFTAEFQRMSGKAQSPSEERYQKVKESYETAKRNQNLEKLRQKLEEFHKPGGKIYGTAGWKNFLQHVASI